MNDMLFWIVLVGGICFLLWRICAWARANEDRNRRTHRGRLARRWGSRTESVVARTQRGKEIVVTSRKLEGILRRDGADLRVEHIHAAAQMKKKKYRRLYKLALERNREALTLAVLAAAIHRGEPELVKTVRDVPAQKLQNEQLRFRQAALRYLRSADRGREFLETGSLEALDLIPLLVHKYKADETDFALLTTAFTNLGEEDGPIPDFRRNAYLDRLTDALVLIETCLTDKQKRTLSESIAALVESAATKHLSAEKQAFLQGWIQRNKPAHLRLLKSRTARDSS